MTKLTAIIALIALSFGVQADAYWETEIPVMKEATNVVTAKDRERASIQTSYDILLTDFRDPLKFYGPFLEKSGWKHHMADVYSKFPEQFQSKLPGQEWTSFSAAAEDGSYKIRYGTLWQNSVDGTNATITMTLSGIKDDRLIAHVDVVLAPQIDGSPFLELVQRTKDDPKATLRLAEIAGGDPFDIGEVNLEKIRSVRAPDELTRIYVKAVDSVLAQFKQFSASHIPAE